MPPFRSPTAEIISPCSEAKPRAAFGFLSISLPCCRDHVVDWLPRVLDAPESLRLHLAERLDQERLRQGDVLRPERRRAAALLAAVLAVVLKSVVEFLMSAMSMRRKLTI